MAGIYARPSLLLRVDALLCAIPLAGIVEILRPLPLETLTNAPAFVAGLAVIRGEPVAIVSLAHLLGNARGTASRFVVLRLGERRVGLAVHEIVGVRALDPELLGALPSLISRAATAVEAIGTLDGELLLALDSGRLVPNDVLALADAHGLAS